MSSHEPNLYCELLFLRVLLYQSYHTYFCFRKMQFRIYTIHIPPAVLKKVALRWKLNKSARACFVHLVWINIQQYIYILSYYKDSVYYINTVALSFTQNEILTFLGSIDVRKGKGGSWFAHHNGARLPVDVGHVRRRTASVVISQLCIYLGSGATKSRVYALT